jgi:hypothetical protein
MCKHHSIEKSAPLSLHNFLKKTFGVIGLQLAARRVNDELEASCKF